MLLKTLVCTVALSFLPAVAQTNGVKSGMFEDGTRIMWQCPPKFNGKIPFMVVLPDGKQYHAELVCGSPTAKDI